MPQGVNFLPCRGSRPTWHRDNCQALSDCTSHKLCTGIADSGHASVRHQRYCSATPHTLQHLWAAHIRALFEPAARLWHCSKLSQVPSSSSSCMDDHLHCSMLINLSIDCSQCKSSPRLKPRCLVFVAWSYLTCDSFSCSLCS